MVSVQDPPLDETVWAAPEIAREMGGIHTNTILPYFSQSHFFDATSNNATLTTQALYNQNLYPILQTREAFEGRLRTMQGLEFMVTHDPSENDTKHNHNGVWGIRKQIRRKRQAMQDEITSISSYFVIGENVYMAPSVGSVLNSRLLSTVTSLTKMLSSASSLPNFTPALGHTYFPINTQSHNASTSNFQPSQTSETGSPPPPSTTVATAAGSTPLPTAQETAAGREAHPSQPPASDDLHSSALLAQSFDLYLRYGSEYMDENPLTGEPGSFKLSKSRSGDPASTNSANLAAQASSVSRSKANTPIAGGKKALVELELKTDVSPETENGRKGSGSARSPTTPGTATATAGKKKKERRKSKALGTEDEDGETPRGDG